MNALVSDGGWSDSLSLNYYSMPRQCSVRPDGVKTKLKFTTNNNKRDGLHTQPLGYEVLDMLQAYLCTSWDDAYV